MTSRLIGTVEEFELRQAEIYKKTDEITCESKYIVILYLNGYRRSEYNYITVNRKDALEHADMLVSGTSSHTYDETTGMHKGLA